MDTRIVSRLRLAWLPLHPISNSPLGAVLERAPVLACTLLHFSFLPPTVTSGDTLSLFILLRPKPFKVSLSNYSSHGNTLSATQA
jgi:hypothetical protein